MDVRRREGPHSALLRRRWRHRAQHRVAEAGGGVIAGRFPTAPVAIVDGRLGEDLRAPSGDVQRRRQDHAHHRAAETEEGVFAGCFLQHERQSSPRNSS
jgi:hypothetical protein